MRISAWSSDVCSSDLVVQDLVSDIHARRDRGANRERPRVIIGAVAEVLKYVTGPREGRDAEPVRPFAAHLGRGQILFRAREGDHAMAPYACHAHASCGQLRRPVVGAARAEIRSEEHTSELQSLMRNSYAVFCLKKQ